MASTGALAASLGTLQANADTKLRVTANLIHYGLQVAIPIISPISGEYELTMEVTMSCATPDAVIHYRLDGVTPTEGDPVYTGPITLTV